MRRGEVHLVWFYELTNWCCQHGVLRLSSPSFSVGGHFYRAGEWAQVLPSCDPQFTSLASCPVLPSSPPCLPVLKHLDFLTGTRVIPPFCLNPCDTAAPCPEFLKVLFGHHFPWENVGILIEVWSQTPAHSTVLRNLSLADWSLESGF